MPSYGKIIPAHKALKRLLQGAHKSDEGGSTGRLHCALHLPHEPWRAADQNLRNNGLPPQFDSALKGQEKLETLGSLGSLGE